MSDATRAIFLSYASQDAEAARRLCEALRAAGSEVWFDQSELVGGDAWDLKIRKQIRECALFVPIISANTQARTEGYFRLEWRLADQRTHLMAKGRPFLLPVVIDDTRDTDAHVPDSFLEVQWTRLSDDETTTAFCARVKSLLGGGAGGAALRREGSEELRYEAALAKKPNGRWLGLAVLGMAALGVVAIWQPWKIATGPTAASRAEIPTSGAPAPAARQLIAQAWAQLNKTEMARAELEAAGGYCRRAAELDPTDADVWATWAHVDTWYVYHNFDRSAQRRESARDHSAKALRLAPRSFEARLAQACYWVRAQSSDGEAPLRAADTERLLRELLQEKRDEPRALFALAILQRNTDQPDAARATLERLAQNPEFAATAWNELGWAAMFNRDFGSADADADRSIALQPYWGNLGLKSLMAFVWLGDLDLAQATLDRMPASVLQEDFGATLAITVHQWRRDPQSLLRVLNSLPQEWLRSNWLDGPKVFWIGEARQMAKQTEAARRDFRRALELIEKRLSEDPNNLDLLGLKTLTLHALGEREEAEKTYRLVREMNRKPAVELRLLAETPDAVIDYLESCLESPSRVVTAATLRLNPVYDPLRSHPRFAALVVRAENDPRLSPNAPRRSAAAVPSTDSRFPVTAGGKGVSSDKSVAVLAFVNQSADRENEYFSDGISEELLNVLAKVPGLKVSARTSAFFFKGRQVPISEIAEKLGGASGVEGSVQKVGGRVRIKAQLVKAADGFQVWSENFDRELKDIFALQDEIAGLIAKNLSLRLGATAPSLPVNPEVFRLYLEGLQEWNKRNLEGLAKAQAAFESAIKLEPKFARAYAGLGDVWYIRTQGLASEADAFKTAAARANDAVEQALALDPNLAEPYVTRAMLFRRQNDPEKADADFHRALSLNPNYATAHQRYGYFLTQRGKLPAGLAELEIAMRLDPLAPIIPALYGQALGSARRWAESLAAYERALAIQPDFDRALFDRAMPLIYLHRPSEALAIARQAERDSRYGGPASILMLALAGDRAAAEPLAGRLLANPAEFSTRSILMLCLALGRTDDALQFLAHRSFSGTDWGAFFTWPVFDAVRDHPLFLRKLEEAGHLANYREAWSHVPAGEKKSAQPR